MIPTGVAHGFLALEPLEMLYLVTNAYDGSDELGFAWDDPIAGVGWPAVDSTADGRPIVSDRDRTDADAGRPGGALAPRRTMTGRTPDRTPSHRAARDHTSPPRWAYEVGGTIPRFREPRPSASLRT